MGGLMMPQGHVKILMNTIDYGLNSQAALDAPRWQWFKDQRVVVEHRFPFHLAKQLAVRGHSINIAQEPNSFGRGQIIWRNTDTGVFCGVTDYRTDGCITACDNR